MPSPPAVTLRSPTLRPRPARRRGSCRWCRRLRRRRGSPPVSTAVTPMMSVDDDFDATMAATPPSSKPHGDPVLAILARQSASGLWEEPHRDPVELTVEVMLSRSCGSGSRAATIHGGRIRRRSMRSSPGWRPTARPTWLRGSRSASPGSSQAGRGHAPTSGGGQGSALAVAFGSEPAVRAHVERLAT